MAPSSAPDAESQPVIGGSRLRRPGTPSGEHPPRSKAPVEDRRPVRPDAVKPIRAQGGVTVAVKPEPAHRRIPDDGGEKLSQHGGLVVALWADLGDHAQPEFHRLVAVNG